MRINVSLGTHISQACKEASVLARQTGDSVQFNFNRIEVVAHPIESPATLEAKWIADYRANKKRPKHETTKT